MNTAMINLIVSVTLITCIHQSLGQLPIECTVLRYTRECCPDNGFGVCGGSSRGSCESIINDYPAYDCNDANMDTRYCKAEKLLRTRAKSSPVTDVRYKWPLQIFNRVCKCNRGYTGYNCMRCSRGFRKDGVNDCVEDHSIMQPIRKNFLTLSNEEQNEFMDILEMAKYSMAYGIQYAIPIEQPIRNEQSFRSISLYNAFTIYHYYSNRDKPIARNPVCRNSILRDFCDDEDFENCLPDFAHWGPAFLTWHRGYLLCLENEIRYMLSQLNRTGKLYTADNFVLHYWDWTDEQERDNLWPIIGHDISSMNNDIDAQARFGNWQVICKGHENELCERDDRLCNPDDMDPPVRIQRQVGRTDGVNGRQCLARSFNGAQVSTPPRRLDLMKALNEESFDNAPYWFEPMNGGFRNALEGFEDLGNNRYEVCPDLSSTWPFFELHNRLHLYIGGTMADIVISSNDPIFYLHHSNVDRMYEMWLRRYNGPYKPEEFSYLVAPGHNIRETLVMLFPSITNQDMHKRSNKLGYTYDSLEIPENCNKGFDIHNSVYKAMIVGLSVMLSLMTLSTLS